MVVGSEFDPTRPNYTQLDPTRIVNNFAKAESMRSTRNVKKNRSWVFRFLY